VNFDLKTSILQFLIDQELKGNSKRTIEYYKANLGYFSNSIGEDKLVKDITIDDLKQYHLYIKSKPRYLGHQFKPKYDTPVKSISVQTYIRAVKVFMKWLFQEGYIGINLSAQFKLPKATKKVVEILSDDEIDLLMKSMKQTTEMGLRNSCIVALMLDCGLRKSEVHNLNVEDVHLTQSLIKVKGKGDKERIVPIGLYTKRLLLKYLNGFRVLSMVDNKRLFIDKEYKPMSLNAIKQLIMRLKKKTNINRLHPHILRHTFSTKYLVNGGDIFSLQLILGHTSLEMVRRYSHLASSYILTIHKKYSPLDNLQAMRLK
jgi:integrase/recombinase XerC/integrase/recombinase XerD